MFLVVITDRHFGSKCEFALIRCDNLIDDLQKCCLSGSVITNHSDMFATFDLKTDIMEENLIIKLL